jgi:hypothetical protein
VGGGFLYGISKNERGNIKSDELTTLRDIATGWLGTNNESLEHAIDAGHLQEISYEEGK